MKKLFLILFVAMLVAMPLVSSQTALAQIGDDGVNPPGLGLGGEGNIDVPDPVNDFSLRDALDVVALILRVMYIIFFIVAALYIILAAFDYVTKGPEGADEARKKLIYAGIGIAVALIAFGIGQLVRGIID